MDIKALPLEVQAVIYRAVRVATYPPRQPTQQAFRTSVRWQDILLLRDELQQLGVDIGAYMEDK